MRFGACGSGAGVSAHMRFLGTGTINVSTAYSIVGSANFHIVWAVRWHMDRLCSNRYYFWNSNIHYIC